MFNIAAFQADQGLQRRLSSLVPYSASQLSRSLSRNRSREHDGLMSWPEHMYKLRQDDQTTDGDHWKLNSLSSKVGMHEHIQGSQSIQVKRSRSLAYRRVHSNHTPLVSVRSEGPATVRRGLVREKLTGENLKPPQGGRTNEAHEVDDSSEGSGAEDELIVRIDSPSKLSFHQAS